MAVGPLLHQGLFAQPTLTEEGVAVEVPVASGKLMPEADATATPAGADPAASATDTPAAAVSADGGTLVLLSEVNTRDYPLVQLFVTVLRDGEPQQNLTAGNFEVREDGVQQSPINVAPMLPPVNVVLALDTSGSMKDRMPEVRSAATNFLGSLHERDRAQVLTFERKIVIHTKMTPDKLMAEEIVAAAQATGDTALYDALYESVRRAAQHSGRRAVVLLSDGKDDNGKGKPLSKRTVEEVLALAAQENVPVYAIGLGGEVDEPLLRDVAERTGGQYFSAPEAAELAAIYTRISRQLAGQYSITYTSSLVPDGKSHEIAVTADTVVGSKEFLTPGGETRIPLEATPAQKHIVDRTTVAADDSPSAGASTTGVASRVLKEDAESAEAQAKKEAEATAALARAAREKAELAARESARRQETAAVPEETPVIDRSEEPTRVAVAEPAPPPPVGEFTPRRAIPVEPPATGTQGIPRAEIVAAPGETSPTAVAAAQAAAANPATTGLSPQRVPDWVSVYPGAVGRLSDFSDGGEGKVSGTVSYSVQGVSVEKAARWFYTTYEAQAYTLRSDLNSEVGEITARRSGVGGLYEDEVVMSIKAVVDPTGVPGVQVAQNFSRTPLAL